MARLRTKNLTIEEANAVTLFEKILCDCTL